MSCYLRHLSGFLQTAGIELDKSNRKQIHEILKTINNMQDERCGDVWKKLKAQLADEKSRVELIDELKKAYKSNNLGG